MDLQVAKTNTACTINISKIIPISYKRQLILVPYTIATSQQKKAGKILQILKQTQQQLDATKNKQQTQHNTKQKYQNQKPNNPNPTTQLLKQQTQKIIYHHNKIENNQINQQNPFMQTNSFKQKASKNFLKRIRNVQGNIEIIICKNDQEEKDRIIKKLQKLQLIDKLYIKQLPAEAPLTKLQFQQWSKLWPINYIQQQISKQVIHSPAQISFLDILHTNKTLYPNSFYLIDSKLSQILLQQIGSCSQQTIFHPIIRLLQKWPLSSSYNKKPQKYYYLTELKMYVRDELCGMCTMALVHSRLKAIYMSYKPTQVMDKIMGNKRLNHQIMMFTVK